LKTPKDTKKALTKIEQAYAFEPWASHKNPRKKNDKPEPNGNIHENGNSIDTSSSDKIQCRSHGHDHLWKDCHNNPDLSSFTGTYFLVIPDRERAVVVKDDDLAPKFTKSKHHTKRREDTHMTEESSFKRENGGPTVIFQNIEQILEEDASYK
jgi:hypothetical protein